MVNKAKKKLDQATAILAKVAELELQDKVKAAEQAQA
jgi:hypothetical protein